jgi:hypothetical protein
MTTTARQAHPIVVLSRLRTARMGTDPDHRRHSSVERAMTIVGDAAAGFRHRLGSLDVRALQWRAFTAAGRSVRWLSIWADSGPGPRAQAQDA